MVKCCIVIYCPKRRRLVPFPMHLKTFKIEFTRPIVLRIDVIESLSKVCFSKKTAPKLSYLTTVKLIIFPFFSSIAVLLCFRVYQCFLVTY